MNQLNNHSTSLPHHRLLAYQKSLELLAAVRSAQIRDAKLRDEALRAAKGSCLNIAEGAPVPATVPARTCNGCCHRIRFFCDGATLDSGVT
jgi:hypothetical protein